MIKCRILLEDDFVFMEISLPFVPRTGEYISIESEGSFTYYDVKEVWISVEEGKDAVACLKVSPDS